VNLYLADFRGAITGANTHQGLWSSAKGHPMSGGAIYDAVRRRTIKRLGLPVNLHRFRGVAGNLWSILDPANVRGVKDLLGHADFGTTENTTSEHNRGKQDGRLQRCFGPQGTEY
jgi:site-specific recombinase XerC